MRKAILLFLISFATFVKAQELNATVKVNFEQVANNNPQVYKTLERSLLDFINKTKWTSVVYKSKEKIDCAFFINITAASNDMFEGTIQISSSRPVFGSTYTTPVFNYNDKDFSFKYIEFEPLLYNPNSYDSNLISIVAFYANIIIAFDADSFAPMGGTEYLKNASEIATVAQQGGLKGWNQSSGVQNRYFMANDLLAPIFAPIRETIFDYHINGLDQMGDKTKDSKEVIKKAIFNISKIQSARPNAFVTRLFFDAKSDEIQSIFSGGPQSDVSELIDQLNRFSPANSSKWATLKN